MQTWGKRVLVGACGVLLAALTWWMLVSGDKGVAAATVLAFTVGVLALAVAVFGVPWRRQLTGSAELVAATRSLARQIGQREAAEQQKFLADSGQARPADVGYAQPELVSWRTDGGDRSGRLSDIAEFYAGLNLGRLVICGEAGAGKTVLANQLVIDLIGRIPSTEPLQGTVLSVPVRLSLASFDPGPNYLDVVSDVLAARLEAWIANQLASVYGVRRLTATWLVKGGWILPVLDGLDEMDPEDSAPSRASATVRALNHPAGIVPRPVVLTCRTNRYQQLTTIIESPGKVPVLQDATVVEVQPLTIAQVTGYLTRRFPDVSARGHIQQRWQPVIRQIHTKRAGPLTNALTTPLRLFMASVAYHSTTANPAELTRIPKGQIDRHLVSTLIPAVTELHARSDGSIYRSTDVTRWLTTLARQLDTQQVRQRGSGSDIDLHLLWTAAGDYLPRYVAACLHALLVALPVGTLAIWCYTHTNVGTHPHAIHIEGFVIGVGIVGTVLVVRTAWRASRRSVDLRRLDPSWLRTRTGHIVAIVGIICVVAFLVNYWLPLRSTGPIGILESVLAFISFAPLLILTFALISSTLFGRRSGLVYTIMDTLSKRPSAISRPSQLITQGLTCDLTISLIFGFIASLIPALVVGVELGSAFGFRTWFATWLTVGAWWFASSPWLRYYIAVGMLAKRGLAPARLARFLDWAYTAGLLRLSGISIQFRHRELQNQLVSTYGAIRLQRPPGAGGARRHRPVLMNLISGIVCVPTQIREELI